MSGFRKNGFIVIDNLSE